MVIATGTSVGGRREVLGFDVGDSESGAFWPAVTDLNLELTGCLLEEGMIAWGARLERWQSQECAPLEDSSDRDGSTSST